MVAHAPAVDYGLVGPIARASGIGRDLRKLFPYAAYGAVGFEVPIEAEGDGYARLRVLFREAGQAVADHPPDRGRAARGTGRDAADRAPGRRRARRGRGAARRGVPLAATRRGRHRRPLADHAAVVHQLAWLPSRRRELRLPGLPDHHGELRAVQRRVRSLRAASMTTWVFAGLRTGIKSSRYPEAAEAAAGVSPGRPATTAVGRARGGRPTGGDLSDRRAGLGAGRRQRRLRSLRPLFALRQDRRRRRGSTGRTATSGRPKRAIPKRSGAVWAGRSAARCTSAIWTPAPAAPA